MHRLMFISALLMLLATVFTKGSFINSAAKFQPNVSKIESIICKKIKLKN